MRAADDVVRDEVDVGLRVVEEPRAPAGVAARPLPPPVSSRWRSRIATAGLALAGAATLIAAWQLVSLMRAELPGPVAVARELARLVAHGFADNGPNDKGIFLLLGSSLAKVFMGFTVAALVGVPVGFVIGASSVARRALDPIVQILRPVSPLAWFPIALVLFKDSHNASVYTIAITALWPTLINTAVGVASVPEDHRNVAKVFRFDRRRTVRHILLPYSMTSIITGLRLSMGIAWMVIVATEMLSGSSGIGFFVWDSYNGNNLAAVLSAILFIGTIGLALDIAFHKLARRYDYSEARA